MSNESLKSEYCYKFKILGLCFTGGFFPVTKYEINDNLVLIQDRREEENAIACFFDSTSEEERLSKYQQVEKIIMNYVSLLNLFGPLSVTYRGGGYQSYENKETIEDELKFIELRITGELTEEQQEEESKRLLKQLEQSKNLWNIFSKMPDNKFKKNLINSLHYYYYGKNADRYEEKIVNYITALECLFLNESMELSYKLSLRSSYLISNILSQDWYQCFTYIKKMYGMRSGIVHTGMLRGEFSFKDMTQLAHFVSVCIRAYISLYEKYHFDNKNQIIQFIESGIFGNEIEIPTSEELNFI
jgi:hypothetical protein